MKLRMHPSMKEKKRYVTFSVISEKKVGYGDVKGAITNSILNWMGEKGISSSGFRIIRNLWDSQNQEGWLSCTPASVDDIRMSLALVHQIGDSRVIFRTLRVSGTIKSGKEKLGR